MRKIGQLFLFSLICLLLTGCSDKNVFFNPEEFYSLKDTLKGKILSSPLDTYCNLYYSEYGLFACTKKESRLFQLLDSADASRITTAGKRGRGPNEFLAGMGMQYEYASNRFSVYDLYRQELATYLVSPDSISLIRTVNLKRDLKRIKYINDSLMAFVNFYPYQKIGLINSDAEIVYEEEHNPLSDERIKTTNGYYNANVDVSPDKTYTVVTDSDFTSIQVFMNKPDSLQLKWEKILFKPKYRINSEKNWFILNDDHYYGFRWLYLTNKYIYLSCNDRQVIDSREKRPNPKHTYLLVMDYEGNIVNKYLMDKFFAIFAVSPDDKSLYANIDDPDLLIAKYAL